MRRRSCAPHPRLTGAGKNRSHEVAQHPFDRRAARRRPGRRARGGTRRPDGGNTAHRPDTGRAEDDWVLAAPYGDKSLMRNVLAHRTARAMGRYAPRTRFVELVLNGDYAGV